MRKMLASPTVAGVLGELPAITLSQFVPNIVTAIGGGYLAITQSKSVIGSAGLGAGIAAGGDALKQVTGKDVFSGLGEIIELAGDEEYLLDDDDYEAPVANYIEGAPESTIQLA